MQTPRTVARTKAAAHPVAETNSPSIFTHSKCTFGNPGRRSRTGSTHAITRSSTRAALGPSAKFALAAGETPDEHTDSSTFRIAMADRGRVEHAARARIHNGGGGGLAWLGASCCSVCVPWHPAPLPRIDAHSSFGAGRARGFSLARRQARALSSGSPPYLGFGFIL